MPFDGSGNFNRALGPTTWQNDAAAGIKIKANLHDNNDNDIANGLSQVICKDGQSSPTADITLNGHKLINVANPSNPQDAMTLNTFAASAVRYDVGQALSIAQQLIAHTNLAATMSVAIKSGAYSLLQSDRGKLLRITAAATITLPAATAVGNDFSVDFRTMGGVMTLAPNGTNQIEGVNANYPVPDNSSGTLWCDGTNWWVGLEAVAPKVTFVTVSNATFALDKATKRVEFALIAPGGGSGGVAGANPGSAASGCGGGGEYAFLAIDNPNTATTWNITIGAPGAAGTAGANAGGTGGTTTVTDGTNTVTAIGGDGGAGMAATTTNAGVAGGFGGSGGTGGTAAQRIAGGNGGAGQVFNGLRSSAARGGDAPHGWGLGGCTPTNSNSAGLAGTGYGSGCAGAQIHNNTSNLTGGLGRPSAVVVTEYR